MEDKFLVYILIDPIDQTIRYVGKTTDRVKSGRYRDHKTNFSYNKRKSQWIKNLQGYGFEPIMKIISEHKTEREALDEETRKIKYYLDLGTDLVNSTEGGDSPKWTPELRTRMSQRLKGSKQSLETKAKIAKSMTGKKLSESHKANIAKGGQLYREKKMQGLTNAVKAVTLANKPE